MMKNNRFSGNKRKAKRIIVFLCILLAVRILIQLALYENGFISVSADEFARGIRAAQWAQNPSVNILSDIRDTWLPFEKYLNGFVLLIWPDVIWAPRLTVFIASCLVSIVLFSLFETLFENSMVAGLSITFLVFQPWYVWLSGTPMLEMYYFLFFFLGVYLFICWIKKGKSVYWLLGGLSFLIATGFHVQSWVYINLFNLLTLGYFINNLKQKRTKNIYSLLGFYFLGNSLIFTFSLLEFIDTGRVFGFLSNHTSYSKWFYGGYSVPVLEKALYYPKLILSNVNSIVWVLLILTILVFVRERVKLWKLFPLFFSLLALLATSVMNIISVPATAAPGRYSLIYSIVLAPYISYGLVRVFSQKIPDLPKIVEHMIKILPVIVFIYAIVWGLGKLPDYDRVVSMDAVKTGSFINERLDQYSRDQIPQTMVELKYWDFLGVKTAVVYYDHVIYDREYDIYNRNTESIFSVDAGDICPVLFSQNVKYIALRQNNLKIKAEALSCLRSLAEYGSWTVYEFALE